MNIDNLFSGNEAVCIGISYNKRQYTKKLGEFRSYHDCIKKVDEIRNGLFNSGFTNEEKEEIIKSVLLQIQGGQLWMKIITRKLMVTEP